MHTSTSTAENPINKIPDGENFDVDGMNAPEWLKEGLKKLDTDGDGLEREEVEELLNYMASQKLARKNNSPELE
jgi:hypothetical protein